MRRAAIFTLAAAVAEGRPVLSPDDERGLPRIHIPEGTRAVWFDIGTASHTDFENNLLQDPHLFMVGIEPNSQFVERVRGQLEAGDARGRFMMIDRACTLESGGDLPFHVHEIQECNSLNEADPSSPVVDEGACVGRPSTSSARVQGVALRGLLEQLPPGVRVQLLKLDVQGHEWPCISGAAEQLERVDNIYLEVQDTLGSSMYKNQVLLGDMDLNLEERGFVRQYCEFNNPTVRELNCLYTQRGRPPLWVTGRPQGTSPFVKFDTEAPPGFAQVFFCDWYWTSNHTGALTPRLRRWRTDWIDDWPGWAAAGPPRATP